ncbi:MAG: hypothetical protein CME21_14770 [Gemmatimonadetes bacterium]|jgi:Xaa-Pro aminopeptidase|nr:hypothetical protein [Gemmatimonadota bacterium]
MPSIPERLKLLREKMLQVGVQAYLIPNTDAHQSEYVPACWQRRPWISGFTGSAGDVVVTLDDAGLWTDSRYFLQAEDQLAGSTISLFKSGLTNVPTKEEWLGKTLEKGDRVGVDPRVVGIKAAREIKETLGNCELELNFLPDNLIDSIWEGQPSPSKTEVQVLGEGYSGEPIQAKLHKLRERMGEVNVDSHVVTALDAIAWLFNLRGRDVDYNPVFIAYAVVTRDDAFLFIDAEKVSEEAREALEGTVSTRPYEEIESFLSDSDKSGNHVWLDEGATNKWIEDLVGNRAKRAVRSPIAEFKAIKNHVELTGIRKAHLIDGVAMVKFLKWLEETVGQEAVTELSAAKRLLEFRSEGEGFVGASFPTISGYGPHGAIVHYSVTKETDIPIERDNLYLVDSGGQYLFGTTDITRTVGLGNPTDEQIELYTLVLKGHIELATLSFPDGTTGQIIDLAARRPLWDTGRNYLHGTGHGIGHYLNVHEGPISIGPRAPDVKFAEGHVISNEPGYYKDGSFGIRTENLVTVVSDAEKSSNLQKFWKFDTLTRCPIATNLVDRDLLGETATDWLNAYHETVKNDLTPELNAETADWLAGKTQPI